MQKVITMLTLQEEQPPQNTFWSSVFSIAYNIEKS